VSTRIDDVLLTALGHALSGWVGTHGPVLVYLDGHGRERLFEDVDLSRTVGWFTSLYPVLLEIDEGADPGRALMSVREQLWWVPSKGVGYQLLRHLRADAELAGHLASLPAAEVGFNYLGRFDTRSGWMPLGARGPSRDHDSSRTGRRAHLLEIDGAVEDRRLWLRWSYSRKLHDERTVRGVADTFLAELRELIEHCCSPVAGGVTPSDFPLAALDQTALDRFLV
jgi:non-ribosomal peptide synthase protein (TIGR01720 family)